MKANNAAGTVAASAAAGSSARRGQANRWILAGLSVLPVYALLTAWSSLEPQPDQVNDAEGWAEFVSSDSYLISHVLGSTGGTILAIFGFFALGIYLATGRSRRLALSATVLAVAGQALLLVPAAISTFATPAIGQAYLAGVPGVMDIQFPDAMTVFFMLGLLFAFVGSILLGVVMLRTRIVPRLAGAAWLAATVTFYLVGVLLGQATTGSSLPTQSIGALLLAIAGGWIAFSAIRRQRLA